MELTKIRELATEDLRTERAKAGEQLFRIRFQKALGNQEGLKRLSSLKLDIARIETVSRERQIAAERDTNPAAKRSAPPPSQRTARKRAGKGQS